MICGISSLVTFIYQSPSGQIIILEPNAQRSKQTAPGDAKVTFEIHFFGGFLQLLRYFFPSALTAGGTFSVAVIGAEIKLPLVRL
jgi:hypothetical protein